MRAIKTGQTPLEQAKTVLLMARGFIANYQSKGKLLQWPTWSSLSCHSHCCRRASKTGQMTLEQAETTAIDEPDFIISYHSN